MTMKTRAGDRVIVESEKVGQPARTGVVEEVLDEEPLRVRIHWDDGHTSVLTPSAGAVRIESARTGRTGASAQRAGPAAGVRPSRPARR